MCYVINNRKRKSRDASGIPKVILWSAPRCVSTAFERSMREHGGIKAYHELYTSAAYEGEERFYPRYGDKPPTPNSKYSDVRQQLESSVEGFQGVFAKEHAYALPKTRREDALPDGYSHTFLIRMPRKSVASLWRAAIKNEGSESPTIYDGEIGICELLELFKFIRDSTGETPLVIDADDLLNDPAPMMKKYCDYVGFEFKESMLHWKAGSVDDWDFEGDWYDTVMKSTGFLKPDQLRDVDPDVSTLPQHVQQFIQEAEPGYQEMYKLRMKP
ncbi:uncharacterized protein [Ptychodera flava]|uniref:uncharacterized protein n=1 Tax=Ptychodera flava TaxID=63121 RepID=UPI003969E44A